jgi:dimeric dUTPase (all-alpha-NTP-PPase superfamily)
MINKLENCRELQGTMNSLVNPNWKKANYNFPRAAWMEMGEALSTVDWKWWKKQTPDQYQLKLEMVDILHFMLSDAILNQIITPRIRDIWTKSQQRFPKNLVNDVETVFQFGELFIRSATDGQLYWGHYFDTMLAMGIDFNEVIDMYIAKNTLNVFRQKHGYKDGTYIKEWFGEEDNKTLERIVLQNPTFDFHQIYAALEVAYSEVLSAHFNN